MSAPVLLAVDEDLDTLWDIGRELSDRYGRHYRVIAQRSSGEALAALEELAAAGDQVALILAGQWLSGMTGTDLLDQGRHLHPHAKRGLVIPWGGWGERATGEAIFDAIAHGRIDHYVLRPAASPDELFHQAISSLLLEWAESRHRFPHTVSVVGESWAGRAYELRETLGRCALPHAFYLADSSEGRALVEQAGAGARLPLVVFPDGTVLADPTNAAIATAGRWSEEPEQTGVDLLIVGAGPAGLSAAVYGASEGFTTLVVDEGGIGGQATSSSLIRNYLGFPRGLSGRRLAQQAYEQAWVFGAKFAFMEKVTGLGREARRLVVRLQERGPVSARAVLLATGASYRRLGVPALEALTGAGVYYGGPASEASAMSGQEVYVLGGANSAGQAALFLARYARRVTLVVRADSLGAGMSHYLVRQVEAQPRLHVRLGTEVTGGGGDGWLERLVLRDRATGQEETVEAGGLFLMIGARPRTDWLPPEVKINRDGFVLTGTDLPAGRGWPLERTPLLLESGMPGVFAAGDVRHGSVKRVASAVGEGSVAIQLLHRLFAADGSADVKAGAATLVPAFQAGVRGHTGPMPKNILALVSEPISKDALFSAVGVTDAEILVVAPALNTRTRFLASDPDPAIERAEQVVEETVERLQEEGVEVAGDTGESDPLLALQDALATYPADQIVLFTHPDGERNWLEEGVVEEARERFDVPVEHMVVERG